MLCLTYRQGTQGFCSKAKGRGREVLIQKTRDGIQATVEQSTNKKDSKPTGTKRQDEVGEVDEKYFREQ